MENQLKKYLKCGDFKRCIGLAREEEDDDWQQLLARMLSKAKNVHLTPEDCQWLHIEAPECPGRIIIPVVPEQQQESQAILAYPAFNFEDGGIAVEQSRQKALRHLEDSINDAYQALLPVAWQIRPMVCLERNYFIPRVTMAGDVEFEYPIQGRSAGLGLLMAMLLQITDLELAQTVAFTGSVQMKSDPERQRLQDIPVYRIDSLAAKIAAIHEQRPDVDKIIIPHANEAEYQNLRYQHNVILVKTVSEAMDICFGEKWKLAKIRKGIQKGDPELFFAAARRAGKNEHRESLARLMFFHLQEFLEPKEDVLSRNLLCKTNHRLAGTYDLNIIQACRYYDQSRAQIAKLKQEGMIDDLMEEGKILTSYSQFLLQSFEFTKAEEQNQEALKLAGNRLIHRANYCIQGQILLHQGKFAEAEKSFLLAKEVSAQAKDRKTEIDDGCHLLQLYVLAKNWPQAESMYRELAQVKPSEYCNQKLLRETRQEYLAWAYLYGCLPEDLQQELAAIHGGGPKELFYAGLVNIDRPQQAIGKFKSAANAFANLNQLQNHATKRSNIPVWYGDLWSVLPLVGQYYAESVAQKRSVLDTEKVKKIQNLLTKYALNELEKSLLGHIGRWTQCQDLDALRDWFHGFRCLIPTQ